MLVELNNEIAGPGKQERESWFTAGRLPDEPGVLSNRIANATAARILTVRMLGKPQDEVAAGNLSQRYEREVSVPPPRLCTVIAVL